jgi:hypothetical protein
VGLAPQDRDPACLERGEPAPGLRRP